MSVEATTAAPVADPSKVAAPVTFQAPTAPPPEPTIAIPVSEFSRYRDLEPKIAEIQRATQAALEAKEQERIHALAENGKIKDALEQLGKSHNEKLNTESQRYANLEREYFTEKKTAAIATVLAGKQFVSQAALNQVQMILENNVEVIHDGSGVKVVDKLTRQPATKALADLLASDDYAHFFAPTTRQGGANQGGGRADSRQQEAPAPGSLQAIVDEFLSTNVNPGGFSNPNTF